MGADRLGLPVLLGLAACVPSVVVEPDATVSDSGTGGASEVPEPHDTGQPANDAACGLSVDLTERFFVEGDTLAFTVTCRDRSVQGAGVSVAGAGPGAVFDADSGAFSWTTDGTMGGRYDITVGTSAGGVLESVVLPVWVADDPRAPNAAAPEPLVYTEEWGLPVVHIEVDRRLDESEQDAVLTVRNDQVTGSAKVRGASSTSYPKVSYTLDFDSDELGVTEWGDRTREHMVLITSFDDNSYVRQKLGYDLWMAMAEQSGELRLTPRTFFAVVYINGDYQGLYTACDRIDDEFLRHMGTEGEGSLYKAVSHDANFYLTGASGSAKGFLGAGYEKKEGDDADWSDLEALVAHTGGVDDDTLWMNSQGLDLGEFADWMIWAQLTLAQDSAGKNSYLFADPVAGRWRLTPWDLNESFGQNWYTLRLPADRRNDYIWNNRVFAMLQEHPEARAFVEARYADYRENGPLQPAVLQAMIDGYIATLGPNIDRDWDRWGDAYESYDRWERDRDAARDWTTPDEEVAYIRAWIDDRFAMYDREGPI